MKKKNALPKVRLGHAFARLFQGHWSDCHGIAQYFEVFWLVAMVTKCTVKGTSCVWENALSKVRQKLSFFSKSLSSCLGWLARWTAEEQGTVLGSFLFLRTILSIPTSIPQFQTNTLRCNRTLRLLLWRVTLYTIIYTIILYYTYIYMYTYIYRYSIV